MDNPPVTRMIRFSEVTDIVAKYKVFKLWQVLVELLYEKTIGI